MLTQIQYNNFLSMFMKNKTRAEFMLLNKMFQLFDFDSNISDIYSYSKNKLIKLNNISKKIPLESAIKLFNKFNYKHITKFNYHNLLLYLRDMDNFKNHKIKITWGPGNHKNVRENVNEHYIKHVLSNVLSNEQIYWERILDTVNCESYKSYAINSFYKLKKVLVHTDGVNVYMSGFHHNVFIIGRYDGDMFGISSCYYVENGEKLGRYKGLCFKIDL